MACGKQDERPYTRQAWVPVPSGQSAFEGKEAGVGGKESGGKPSAQAQKGEMQASESQHRKQNCRLSNPPPPLTPSSSRTVEAAVVAAT